MRNPSLERSGNYAGILGAILFALSGILPGQLPPTDASATDISTYIDSHRAMLALSGWLAVPAVVFILWFAYGTFDRLRDPEGRDRPLLQWGGAGVVTSAALTLASAALEAVAGLRPLAGSDALALLYVFSVALFVFSMGGFAVFAFSVATAARRRRAMPGWLNAFGYLIFVIDALYTLTVLVPHGLFSPASIWAIITGLLSALWVLVASIVLLASTPKAEM